MTNQSPGFLIGLKYANRIADKFVGHVDDEYRGEAYSALVEAALSYDPNKGTWKYWVARCVRNRLIGYKRKTKSKCQPLGGREYKDKSSFERFTDLSFEEMIENLTDKMKTVARLRFVHNRSIDEIASIVGVNNTTVDRWLTSIKDQLRVDLS